MLKNDYVLTDVPALKGYCLGKIVTADGKSTLILKQIDSTSDDRVHSAWSILKPYVQPTETGVKEYYKTMLDAVAKTDSFGIDFWLVIKYSDKPWKILELENLKISATNDGYCCSYDSLKFVNYESMIMYYVLGDDDLLNFHYDWSNCKTALSPSQPTRLTANIPIPKRDLRKEGCTVLTRETSSLKASDWNITDLKANEIKVAGNIVVVQYSNTGPTFRIVKCNWVFEILGGASKLEGMGLMMTDSREPNSHLSFTSSQDISKIQEHLKNGRLLVVKTVQINIVKKTFSFRDVLSPRSSTLKECKLPVLGDKNGFDIVFNKDPNTWYDVALLPNLRRPLEDQIWIAELNKDQSHLVFKNGTVAQYKTFAETRLIFTRKRMQGKNPADHWCKAICASAKLGHEEDGNLHIPLNQFLTQEHEISTCKLLYLTPQNQVHQLKDKKCSWTGWHYNKTIEVEADLQSNFPVGTIPMMQLLNKVTWILEWKRLTEPTIVTKQYDGTNYICIISYAEAIPYEFTDKMTLIIIVKDEETNLVMYSRNEIPTVFRVA